MSVVATALGYSLLLIATSVKTQMLAEDAQEVCRFFNFYDILLHINCFCAYFLMLLYVFQGMCHMCNELMSERYVDTNDLQEEQLEEDKKDVSFT